MAYGVCVKSSRVEQQLGAQANVSTVHDPDNAWNLANMSSLVRHPYDEPLGQQ